MSLTLSVLASDDYSVGFQKVDAFSKETNEKFSVAVIYPTKSPAKPVKFGPFEMKLAIGSAIAKGKFPLVIISHGSGGSNIAHRSIAFALVKRGFVVGMPLHPKNNFKNNSAEGTVSNWINRPKHIKSTLNILLTNRKFSTSIDANEIAVIGHSAGGYTALAVAGGVANTKHMINLCKNNPKLPEPFCGLVKDNQLKSEKIENLRDNRVKAIVLMAPLGIVFKSKESLAKVDIPLLLIKAQKDGVLTEAYESDIIAMNYNKKQLTYKTIANAGHYSFITPLPQAIKSEFGVIAKDPEGFDRKAFHKTLSKEISDYLIEVLN
ncbi:hypothetical protein N8972_00895 [Sulfurospirillum sp.]|nr:hypothetical protein [Sulfurospirillum sp.]